MKPLFFLHDLTLFDVNEPLYQKMREFIKLIRVAGGEDPDDDVSLSDICRVYCGVPGLKRSGVQSRILIWIL